jgi:hypothetical protein
MTDPIERLRVALADRYNVDREIGAGGMARVYRAEDLRHRRMVAVKVLRQDLAAALGPGRFLREISIAAGLNHPHIVALYDSGEATGLLFYVMPLVEGESLRERLAREGMLPIADAVRILRDTADALAYAHNHGVVHRDIKPENVMLTGRHALVTDFGVAKAVSDATKGKNLTTAGVALGTPAYMAPEQATADPQTDHRADIYAWGVVAYEILTGHPPFVRSTAHEIIAAHLTESIEPVQTRRSNLPTGLAGLVMRALEKKPADRWQSAEALVPRLDGVLTPSHSSPTDLVAAVASPASATATGVRRRRLTAALVSLGLVAAAAYWSLGRGPATNPALAVVAPFDNRTGDPALDRVGIDLAERVTLALGRSGVGLHVPAARLRELVGSAQAGSPALARRLASRSGAGLLISGSYGGDKGALEVRAELLRMPAGRRVSLIEAVTGPDNAALADAVAERLAVAVAAASDWGDRFGWGSEHRLARNLIAYRLAMEGDAESAEGNAQAAADRYRRALASDSGYAWAWVNLSWGCWSCISARAPDTLLSQLRSRAASWLPGDRAFFDIRAAWNAQDWERAYQSLATRLTVDSLSWLSLAARAAFYTARLEEVVNLGRRRNEASYWTGPRRHSRLHFDLVNALHGLGRDREALEVAQEHRREFSGAGLIGLTLEFTARAGLGQVAEVERLVAEAKGIRPDSSNQAASLQNNVSRALVAATELKAHGQPDAARGLLAREEVGFRHHLELYPGDHQIWEGLEHILAEAERWTDLLVLANEAAARKPPAPYDLMALQYQALAYAGLGRADSAMALVRRIRSARATTGADNNLWLAGIMMQLGDTIAAMSHFRSSWEAGDWSARGFQARHRMPIGIALRNYPPFVLLTRPTPSR